MRTGAPLMRTPSYKRPKELMVLMVSGRSLIPLWLLFIFKPKHVETFPLAFSAQVSTKMFYCERLIGMWLLKSPSPDNNHGIVFGRWGQDMTSKKPSYC